MYILPDNRRTTYQTCLLSLRLKSFFKEILFHLNNFHNNAGKSATGYQLYKRIKQRHITGSVIN